MGSSLGTGTIAVFTSTESTALLQSLTDSVRAPKVRTGLGVPVNLGTSTCQVLRTEPSLPSALQRPLWWQEAAEKGAFSGLLAQSVVLEPGLNPVSCQGRAAGPVFFLLGSLALPTPDAALYLSFGGRVAMVNTWQRREGEG